jgi:hypothetical protein
MLCEGTKYPPDITPARQSAPRAAISFDRPRAATGPLRRLVSSLHETSSLHEVKFKLFVRVSRHEEAGLVAAVAAGLVAAAGLLAAVAAARTQDGFNVRDSSLVPCKMIRPWCHKAALPLPGRPLRAVPQPLEPSDAPKVLPTHLKCSDALKVLP